MYNLNDLYDEQYFGERMGWKDEVYNIIAQSIIEHFNPRSLIDVGCGNGVLLECLSHPHIGLKGIEGSINGVQICTTKGLNVAHHDLRLPFLSDQKYDVAVSIEVAEHIEEEYADIFIDMLTGLSDTIIFTASPLQDEKYHFNVKDKSYWTEKFSERNYYELECVEFMSDLVEFISSRRDYLYKNMIVLKRKK
jgi:2-polyprenyl-3-methyl-5-hydroxy-6-metoxy-1,4-benzoquinol methylase